MLLHLQKDNSRSLFVHKLMIKMDLPRQVKISNYGLTKTSSVFLLQPKNLVELKNCIVHAKKNQLQISIKGSGNSYADVFFSQNQLLIDTSFLNSIKDFDSDNGIITVETGVQINDLLYLIMPKNWTLVGLSGSVTDKIGGMMSSNTHGKDSWQNGNFIENIISFKILLENESILEVSKEKNSELFYAVIGGLGLFGIIYEIVLKLKSIPSYMLEHFSKNTNNVHESIAHFNSLENSDIDFSYCLIDSFSKGNSLGAGVCESAKFIDMDNSSLNNFKKSLKPNSKIFSLKPESFWSLARPFWNNSTCNLLNKSRSLRSSILKGKKTFLSFPEYQYPYTKYPKFNLIYGDCGFIEFQIIFSKINFPDALEELLTKSHHFGVPPWICMMKKHKPDNSFLSFSGDGFSVSINFPVSYLLPQLTEKYCNEILEIILKYNGKTYISKSSYLPKSIFQEMYPNYKKIISIKSKYDPNQIFYSDSTIRLFMDN